MHILADLLELLLTPADGPQTPRGWLIGSLIFGVVVGGVLAYTLLNSPSKAGTTMILAFVVAPLVMLFAALHYIREPKDRLLSLSTFVANATAVILAAMLWK